MTKKRWINLLQVIIFMGLGIGLIYWRYQEMNLEDRAAMQQSFQAIHWWVMFPIAIIGFLSHYFRALRWKILLKTVNVHASTANTTLAVLIGYLANTVIPRFGEIAKCTVLAKYENTAPEKAIGTIIGERAFDTLSLLVVLCAVLVLEYDVALTLLDKYFGSYLNNNSGPNWFLISILAMLCIGGIACLYLFLTKWRETKIGQLINGLVSGVASIWRLKERFAFLSYSILIWLMYTLMVYVGYWALDATIGLSFSSALAIITFGSIAMVVTPGGIGAYPIIVSAVLLLFGINEGIGMAFGWISWAAQTVLVLILGLLSFIILPVVNGKREKQVREY